MRRTVCVTVIECNALHYTQQRQHARCGSRKYRRTLRRAAHAGQRTPCRTRTPRRTGQPPRPARAAAAGTSARPTLARARAPQAMMREVAEPLQITIPKFAEPLPLALEGSILDPSKTQIPLLQDKWQNFCKFRHRDLQGHCHLPCTLPRNARFARISQKNRRLRRQARRTAGFADEPGKRAASPPARETGGCAAGPGKRAAAPPARKTGGCAAALGVN